MGYNPWGYNYNYLQPYSYTCIIYSWNTDICSSCLSLQKKISKPSAPNVKGKSKFAAFRAQMKKQQETEGPGSPLKTEEKVFEVPGFFTVASPVRSPKPHCEGKKEEIGVY